MISNAIVIRISPYVMLTTSVNLFIRLFFILKSCISSYQLSPIERYAMKFVEETGPNWAAVQIKAVEMEIEQQKREWEEKRLAQRQQEELESQRHEKEESEILTYSREDALNKVNIRSKTKSQVLGKRKSESANCSPKVNAQVLKSNGTKSLQNGSSKESAKKVLKSPPKSLDVVTRRNIRNLSVRSLNEEPLAANTRTRRSSTATTPQLGTSRKSDRSTSILSVKSSVRSTSESTSRSTAELTSHQTPTSATTEDSDSECSLDVMIDSNDVNDSDSNSNQNTVNAKGRSRFDSTSQDDDTLLNDDSTMTDETTIERNLREPNEDGKVKASPRTRSRGTVKIDLWSLDVDSPIIPPKRQKSMNNKSISEIQSKEEKQLRADFGVKECKVAVVDIHLKPPKSTPKARVQRRLTSWLQKPTDGLSRPAPDEVSNSNDKKDVKERVTRQRRSSIMANKTL